MENIIMLPHISSRRNLSNFLTAESNKNMYKSPLLDKFQSHSSKIIFLRKHFNLNHVNIKNCVRQVLII